MKLDEIDICLVESIAHEYCYSRYPHRCFGGCKNCKFSMETNGLDIRCKSALMLDIIKKLVNEEPISLAPMVIPHLGFNIPKNCEPNIDDWDIEMGCYKNGPNE